MAYSICTWQETALFQALELFRSLIKSFSLYDLLTLTLIILIWYFRVNIIEHFAVDSSYLNCGTISFSFGLRRNYRIISSEMYLQCWSDLLNTLLVYYIAIPSCLWKFQWQLRFITFKTEMYKQLYLFIFYSSSKTNVHYIYHLCVI